MCLLQPATNTYSEPHESIRFLYSTRSWINVVHIASSLRKPITTRESDV